MAKVFNSKSIGIDKYAIAVKNELFDLDDPRYSGPDPYLNYSIEDIMAEMRKEHPAIHLRDHKSSSYQKLASDGQESQFDEQDFEQMHPEFGKEPGESTNPSWIKNDESNDRIYSIDNKPEFEVCPKCESESIINEPGNETYLNDHCKSCETQNCGSESSSKSPHCAGCRFPEDGCISRVKKEWNNGASCLACKNTGLISQEKDEASRGVTNSDEKTEITGGGETSGVSHADDYLSNMVHDESGQKNFGGDHEDLGPESVVKLIREHGPARTRSIIKDPGLLKAIDRDIEKASITTPRYPGQATLDDPSVLEKIENQINIPLTQSNNEDDEIEACNNYKWDGNIRTNNKHCVNCTLPESSHPEVPRVTNETHNPWCKCEGTGLVQDPDEISKINNSDEFKNGISNIRKNHYNDPKDRADAKNQFILDQYKCKEM